MVTVGNLTIHFGSRELFSRIGFFIGPRDRIGLVGKNGAGKSTLLKTLAGIQVPNEGSIAFARGTTVGYLAQEMKHSENATVYEEAATAFREVQEMKNRLEELTVAITDHHDYTSDDYARKLDELEEVSHRLEVLGSSNLEEKIEKVLKGLGFRSEDMDRKMAEFSGGWKMRVELGKILLQNPDLLLLDEPTNHLDIEYPGAVVLVSHDRAFLDAVTNRTIEITVGRIEDYKASYSKYVELRKERRTQQMAAYLNQKKMIEDTEKFIDRFRYKASKAVQVQSRIKQLEKVDRIEVEEEDNASIHFRFPPAPRSGKVVITAERIQKSFGEKKVLRGLDFIVERGEKIAFVGRNGEGKTTLSRIITGQLESEGNVELGHNVSLGYFAQNQADTLDPNRTVLETLEQVARNTPTQQIRNLLGAFLFGGEAVDKKVKVLSGGEKGRLAIARLLLEPVNLLILDEPTNHLDMRSKDILKEALRQYDGTMILVSHDREFLDGLCTKVFEFADGVVKEFPGGIFEFLQSRKLESLKSLEQKAEPQKEAKRPEPAAPVPRREAISKEKKQIQNKIKQLEEQIGLMEQRIQVLEDELAKPEVYAHVEQSTPLLKEHQELQQKLEASMQEWERLSESLEGA